MPKKSEKNQRTGKSKYNASPPANPKAISSGPHADEVKMYLDLNPTAPSQISSKQLLKRKDILERSGLSQGFHFSLSYLYQTGVLLKAEQYKDADLYDLVANQLEKFDQKWDANRGQLRNPKDAKLASDPAHVLSARRATCTDEGYKPLIGSHNSVQFIIPKESNHVEAPLTEHALYLATHSVNDVDAIHKERRKKNVQMEKLKSEAKVDRRINDAHYKQRKLMKKEAEKAAVKEKKQKEKKHNAAVKRSLQRQQAERRANGGKKPPKPPSSARERASPPRPKPKPKKASTVKAKQNVGAGAGGDAAKGGAKGGAKEGAKEEVKEVAKEAAAEPDDDYDDDDNYDDDEYSDDNDDNDDNKNGNAKVDTSPKISPDDAGTNNPDNPNIPNNGEAKPAPAAPVPEGVPEQPPPPAPHGASDDDDDSYGFGDDGEDLDFGIGAL